MRSYLIIFFLIAFLTTQAQNLSLIDSINLYNGQSLTIDSQTFTLPSPNYERALELSRRIQYKPGAYDANVQLGNQSINEGKMEIAVKKFQEAYSIAEGLQDPEKIAGALYSMGAVNLALENYDASLKYFQEARQLLIEENKMLLVGKVDSNIGAVLLKMEQGDSAVVYLEQALSIFESENLQEYVIYSLINLGKYYDDKGLPEFALSYYNRVLENDIIESNLEIKGTALMNLGSIYGQLKKYDAAEEKYLEALQIQQSAGNKHKEFIVMDGLAYLYHHKEDYKQAFDYLEKHVNLKDSIIGAENKEKIAALEMQFDVINREKALLESNQKLISLEERRRNDRLRNTIIVFSLIGLLMFGIYLIIRLRQKRRQLMLEKRQISEDLESFKENLAMIEEELETKNQDLTDFALDIARKNKIAAKLVLAINKVEKHLKNKTNEDFKALKSLVTSHQQVNEDIKFFQENIDTVNSDFFKTLKTAYPSLTKNDLQLCGLIRLDLSIKDIANMRNVAAKSIEVSRYRLRKKLALKKGQGLTKFLKDISLPTSD